ncbi:MAG: MoaD/ThiS family protein [Burkholderiaceae bacterium]|nr:MoaD/ThiS family protein [Sulfuritalea sp.]MCF8175101.1 MoaD/ThiS family protein [Burkholderiaceae bacterium]MCF8185142.1 MoaD/ThiS family protein [Polynucleobacter sp.]
MRITFKLFAQLQDYLPAEAKKTNAFSLELAEGSSIVDVIERFNLPPRLVHLVLLDGVHVLPEARPGRKLKDGETLAIWPPVAGG